MNKYGYSQFEARNPQQSTNIETKRCQIEKSRILIFEFWITEKINPCSLFEGDVPVMENLFCIEI